MSNDNTSWPFGSSTKVKPKRVDAWPFGEAPAKVCAKTVQTVELRGKQGEPGPAGFGTIITSLTAPTDLTAGWLDPSDGVLSYYLGGAWVTQTTGSGGIGYPALAYINTAGQPYTNTAGQYYLASA